MIDDCRSGKIDIIVTKSVSRFARNIIDCIGYVRMLKALENPVGVFFETENIFTLDENSEMSLSFIATLAQEESHDSYCLFCAPTIPMNLISSFRNKATYEYFNKDGTDSVTDLKLIAFETDEMKYIIENKIFIINRELEGGYYQLVWKVKTEMS